MTAEELSRRPWRRGASAAGRTLACAAAGLALDACSEAPSTLDPRGPAASRIATLWWVLFAIATVVVMVVTVLLLLALVRGAAATSARGCGRIPTASGTA